MDDLISRQAAIDAINHICPVDTEYDCTLLDRVDVRYVLSDLPSAQPEASILTVTVNPDSEEIERVAREIKDAPVMVLPSAQPERKQGEWVLQSDDYHEYYECDQCGIAVGLDDVRNYCPNCGAKMEV